MTSNTNKRPPAVLGGWEEADLDSDTLKQLTRLLRFPSFTSHICPTEGWLRSQIRETNTLDARVRRPTSVFGRAVIYLGVRGHTRFPSCANLCDSHYGLDPRVVRSLFMLVMDECTVRSDHFRNNPDLLTEPVKAWLSRLSDIVAMWFGNSLLTRVYGAEGAPVCPLGGHFRGSCEACFVAIVGGRPGILADLRSGLHARKTHRWTRVQRGERGRAPAPRLLRAVDMWLSHFGSQVTDQMRRDGDVLAAQVLCCRLAIDQAGQRQAGLLSHDVDLAVDSQLNGTRQLNDAGIRLMHHLHGSTALTKANAPVTRPNLNKPLPRLPKQPRPADPSSSRSILYCNLAGFHQDQIDRHQ